MGILGVAAGEQGSPSRGGIVRLGGGGSIKLEPL